MPPEERKHCQNLPPDILSNLPDNIIDVILLRLPCKEAVMTSILSKKWRKHWCRLTELTIDDSCWSAEEDLQDPRVKFSTIIHQLVTLHKGPITKFTLDIPELRRCPEIEFFIYFLSRNKIQHLVLQLSRYKLSTLPSSLFMCSQLRHLTLHYCSIHPPLAFHGFDKLIFLELYGVTISSEELGSLISHCPLLKQLVLDMPDNLDIIEIDAPMLRSFDFTGNMGSICLKNAPHLVDVSLAGRYGNAKDLDFVNIFESCSALEHLSLMFYSVWLFPEEGYEAPTRLPFYLNSVKRFYLPDIMLVESHELSFSLCLIRSFPYLEYLEIKVYNDDDSGTEESLEVKRLLDVTFNHLSEVKLECFTGRTCEMQLIKLLLANSPVLERMLIDRRILDPGPLDPILKALAENEISNFSHVSPKAEVVYMD